MKFTTACQALILAFAVSACQPFLPLAQHSGSSQGSHRTGTVTVSLGAFQPAFSQASYGIQALPLYAMSHALVEITGPGITTPIWKTVGLGTGALAGKGFVRIENVPLGVNRVVTATALTADDRSKTIAGALVRDVTDVAPGDDPQNTVSLVWQKTPAAEVFVHLQEMNPALAISTSASAVQTTVAGMLGGAFGALHPSLVDARAIAQSIVDHPTHAVPGPDAAFKIDAASLNLVVNGLDSGVRFDAWIDDPASGPKTSLTNGTHAFSGIKPGKWRLHVSSSTFGHIEKELTIVKKSPVTSITIDFSGTVEGNIDFTNGGTPTAPPQPENFAADPNGYKLTVNN